MGLFDALKNVAGAVLQQQAQKQTQQQAPAASDTNWLETLSKIAGAATQGQQTSQSQGGLLDGLQKLQTTATTIAAVKNVMDGKINLQTIGTLLMAYFSSQGTAKKEAEQQGTSIAGRIADAVNLDTVKSITDLVGKLNSSPKEGTTDMATILTSAVTQLIAKK